MKLDKITAKQLVRDMTPYVGILTEVTKYFRAGEDITIFEIGVRRGASTKAFLDGLINRVGGGHLYSCDIDDRNERIVDEQQKKLWIFIHGHSQEIKWNKRIDILLIDGEHTYKAVKKDYQRYEPFVRDRGLIFLHDMNYDSSEASHFWSEIIYPKFILDFNRVGLGIVKKINSIKTWQK